MTVNEVKRVAVKLAVDERTTIAKCVELVGYAINYLDKFNCDTFYIGDDYVTRTELLAVIENLQTLAGAEEMA